MRDMNRYNQEIYISININAIVGASYPMTHDPSCPFVNKYRETNVHSLLKNSILSKSRVAILQAAVKMFNLTM
jgi:hypothetical protein